MKAARSHTVGKVYDWPRGFLIAETIWILIVLWQSRRASGGGKVKLPVACTGATPSNTVKNPMQSVAHELGAAVPLNLPVHSACSSLSTVRICNTFTTLTFEKVGLAFLQKHVAGCLRPAQIRRNQAHHAGLNGAPIEHIILDHHTRMTLRAR
jgi:hypothetical protein